jgi:hypothetical protein
LTPYTPIHALLGIVIVPVIEVGVTLFSTTVSFRLEPDAFRKTTVVWLGLKYVPAIVKLTVVLRFPNTGVIDVMVGGSFATVNCMVLGIDPPSIVLMVMLYAPICAVRGVVIIPLIWFEVTLVSTVEFRMEPDV